MAAQDQLMELADACLAANEVIERHGTSEMRALIRLLLFQVGQELARQQASSQEWPDRVRLGIA